MPKWHAFSAPKQLARISPVPNVAFWMQEKQKHKPKWPAFPASKQPAREALRCATTACQGRKSHRISALPSMAFWTGCPLLGHSHRASSPQLPSWRAPPAPAGGRRIFTLIRFAQKTTRIGYLFSPEFSRPGRFGWWTTSSLPCCQGFASGDQETWPRFRCFFCLSKDGPFLMEGSLEVCLCFFLDSNWALQVTTQFDVYPGRYMVHTYGKSPSRIHT